MANPDLDKSRCRARESAKRSGDDEERRRKEEMERR